MAEFASTNEVRESKRLSYWNDLICETCSRVEITSLVDGPFFGSLATDQLAFVTLAEVTTLPSLIKRPKQFIDDATEDYVKVIYQIAGESISCQEGRMAHLTSGDWVFLDCARPFDLKHTLAYDKNVVLLLHLPKSVFYTRLPRPEALTGYTISSHKGLGRVTYDFIQSLRRDIGQLEPQTKPQLAEILVDLLATNLREMLLPIKATVRNRTVLLLEAKSFINRHLSDPNLSISMIATAVNISRSYLYLLFHDDEHTTVKRYIWDLRLEKCRTDLANPLRSHLTITEIAFAWGFNSSAHFSRSFKERYGLSARSFRQ